MFKTVPQSILKFPKLSACGLGLVSATGFAPLELWPLTLLTFTALMWIIGKAQSQRAAFSQGYWFGVGHFVISLNWIAGAFRFQDTMPVWLGWVAVILLSFYIAVYPALATAFAWRFGRRHHVLLVLFMSGGWIITEYMRATLFTGFSWNPLGAVMLPMKLAGGATVLGTYGLSGLFVMLVGGLFLLSQKNWKMGLGFMTGVVLVSLAFSPFDITQPTGKQPDIVVVQPNIGQQLKYLPGYEAENILRHTRQSGQPGGKPRLILWPEAAVPYRVGDDPIANARLASLLGPEDILITGADKYFTQRTQKGAAVEEIITGAANSSFALNASGKVLWRYDKAHLVPYGEYLALRWLLEPLGATRLVPGAIDFQPGPGPQTYEVPGFGKIGLQICYEIIFSGEVVDRNNRPDFIFNPSNDAWFGEWGSPQFLAQARLRAIEEGLPVIRSTPTGISAVVSAKGLVKHSIPWAKEGNIATELPIAHPPTFFSKWGNMIPLSFAGMLIFLGIALLRRFG